MPQIDIKEIDNTTDGAVEYDEYVVLVPGYCDNPDFDKKATLFESEDDFIKKIGHKDEESDEYVLSEATAIVAEYALLLLRVGLKVLYYSVNVPTDTQEQPDWSDLINRYGKEFKDRGKYDIRFITKGNMNPQGDKKKEIDVAMIRCAAERGDACALIDPLEKDPKEIVTYLTGLIDDNEEEIKRQDDVTESVYKYASAFAPRWRIGEGAYLPASLAYLLCFGNHVKKNPSWFVYAGSERGVIPFANITTEVEFGDAENRLLQERNWDTLKSEFEGTKYIACNTISEIRPFGHIVWGNRTMYPIKDKDNERDLKASSFLNIRNLCTDVKKKLYETSRRYTFEPNTDVLWANFTGKITPLLERMKSNQGIEGYEFERVSVTKKATMKTILHIVPIEGVEDFDLTLSLEDSILTVSE